jgi:hypothetical protein
LRKKLGKQLTKIKDNHPNLMNEDPLLDAITNLFKGKVGESYFPDRLDEIIKEGEGRFEKRIPPGYRDQKKDKRNEDSIRRFGDLLLWFQIIDNAAKNKKPVIFVTDNKKDDWWKRFEGETVGPRPELIHEMLEKAQVDFYMYKGDRFIRFAQEYLKQELDKDAIEEMKQIREEEEEKIGWLDLEEFGLGHLIPWHYRESTRPTEKLSSIPEKWLEHKESLPRSSIPVKWRSTIPEGAMIYAACHQCDKEGILDLCSECDKYFCHSCSVYKVSPKGIAHYCQECLQSVQ